MDLKGLVHREIGEGLTGEPRLVHAETLLETDVQGIRIFAMQVKDNSMEPLISEGEVIFVNPDLPSEPS